MQANIPEGTFPGICHHHRVEGAGDEGVGKARRAEGGGGEKFGGAGYSLTASAHVDHCCV